MSNITVTNHPLIQHKLSILRDKNTSSKDFRTLISEIAMLMCYEATRDLPLKEVEISTPLATAKSKIISGRKLAFIPILRAGLGMVEGVLGADGHFSAEIDVPAPYRLEVILPDGSRRERDLKAGSAKLED